MWELRAAASSIRLNSLLFIWLFAWYKQNTEFFFSSGTELLWGGSVAFLGVLIPWKYFNLIESIH
jgi:hypothetical protein